MADSAKVRLVRCPKCQNLLPELAAFSIYQCGGCGAVLRAKTKNPEGDTFSEKSDEERIVVLSDKPGNSAEEVPVDRRDPFDLDTKSNAGSLRRDPRASEKDEAKSAERLEDPLDVTTGDCVEDGPQVNTDNKDFGDRVSLDSKRKLEGQMREMSEMEGTLRQTKGNTEAVRFSASTNPEAGPSDYRSDSLLGLWELLGNNQDPDGTNKFLQQDRIEILRKLDELKDQLSRSCEVTGTRKDKVTMDHRTNHPDPYSGSNMRFPDGSLGSNRPPLQSFGAEKRAAGPSYSGYGAEPLHYTNAHDMPAHGYYPSVHNPNQVPVFGDPSGAQMLKTAPYKISNPYQQQQQYVLHHSGQCVDAHSHPFECYPRNGMLHRPSCSCFQCQDKYRQPSAVAPHAFHDRRFSDLPNNPMLYHYDNGAPYLPYFENTRAPVPQLSYRDRQSHSRWPNELNSEMGGFVSSRPRRIFLANSGQHCHPIAGGAPFLTCYNCFELLKLPKKILRLGKNQQKIRCGACSAVIYFAIVNKKLVLSDFAEPKDMHADTSLVASNGTSNFHGHVSQNRTIFSSDDYDNSGYDFESMDREPVLLPSPTKLQEMQSFHSSSPCTSEDENGPDVLVAPREVSNDSAQPIKATISPPPAGSPLQEYFDYSSNNHAAGRFAKGNLSSRSDKEKMKTNKVTSRQNSLKETSLATEMEVSFQEDSNTGVSLESAPASKEDDQPKHTKGSESFFANFIKSFKSNQTDERGKSNVSVNGQSIPDRVIKKAEKLAGPIQPGKYWYDFRAGFWGVMGGPCLGIIPPFIEEFNHPMPENCAGGSTGVFVNGRELHPKDLDLLAGRGLPRSSNRSYIIEISGRVLDEETGGELDSLGRLAPTVEKVKRGFGMRIPRGAS